MYKIQLLDLLWIALPAILVAILYIKIVKDKFTPIVAFIRMFVQLILIGFGLNFIFSSNSPLFTIIILLIMILSASIISLRTLKIENKKYLNSFLAILTGGGLTLSIVIFGVINTKIWYEPRVVIPLAGMIFANSLNAISLSAERYYNSVNKNKSIAFKEAFKVSLIPIINSFFAVGLVSLPGMMTGQILSGIDPLIAVRYQILVMLMIFNSAGISVYIYLLLESKIN